MSRQSRWPAAFRAAAWIAFAVAAAWAWTSWTGRIAIRTPADSPGAGGLVLSDLEGRPVPISDYRGRVLILNLWASWCGPCLREIPVLEHVRERFRDRGVEVVGVNADEGPPGEIAEIVARLGIDYPVVVAPTGLREPFSTRGVIPHTWIVDREGRVRASHAGAVGERSLERAVVGLLDER